MRTLIRGMGWRVVVAVALTMFGLTASAGSAQGIPEEFTNLEVLPQGISRGELVSVMRGYSSAVGGRCSSCHMVSDQLDQPTDDFASDEKEAKRKARVMMHMVRDINAVTLTSLPGRPSPSVDVSCDTCHGGVSRPQPIDELVATVLDEEGVDAAVERYRRLRSRYMGGRAYDFSFRPLNRLAERLGRARLAEGVRIAELNAEFNPTSFPTLILLGRGYELSEDTESALRVYRDLIALDSDLPNYPFYAGQARERIEELGGV